MENVLLASVLLGGLGWFASSVCLLHKYRTKRGDWQLMCIANRRLEREAVDKDKRIEELETERSQFVTYDDQTGTWKIVPRSVEVPE